MSQYFSEPYPARAAVQVSALPKNVNFEAEISSGSKKQDLLFDKLGNPVQKKSGSRDNEKEDEEDQN